MRNGRGLPLLEARSSELRRAAALAWREALWLANLTAEPLTIRMAGIEDARLQASLLDASAFEQAARSLHALDSLRRPLKEAELSLDAYAVARVEAEMRQAV
jgi:D-apionolactonase